jgi:hypothetical protein
LRTPHFEHRKQQGIPGRDRVQLTGSMHSRVDHASLQASIGAGANGIGVSMRTAPLTCVTPTITVRAEAER